MPAVIAATARKLQAVRRLCSVDDALVIVDHLNTCTTRRRRGAIQEGINRRRAASGPKPNQQEALDIAIRPLALAAATVA